MYTLLKPLSVREELLKRGVTVLTPELFSRIFQLPPHKTKHFLENQAKEGLFIRLKRGLYILKTDVPHEEEIANAFYKPSYISFEYALAYYHILPEMVYMVTSATTKPTRLFTTSGKSFSYRTIKTNAYTGYILEKKEETSFLIAEPEKAVVDYLYFVSLRKSAYNDRLIGNLTQTGYYKTNALQKEKILQYAALFERKALDNLIDTFTQYLP